MREWIGYHRYLGFEKIYLYHSIGSVGKKDTNPKITKNTTKYGAELRCFGYSDQKGEEKMIAEFNEIWEDFKENIIYIAW